MGWGYYMLMKNYGILTEKSFWVALVILCLLYTSVGGPHECGGAAGRTGTVWEELSPCKASASERCALRR